MGQLYNMIKDAKFFGFSGLPSDYSLDTFVEKALYAYLIPQAWSLEGSGPFVLDTETDCDNGQPTASASYMYEFFQDDDIKNYGYCYNGRSYYLAGAKAKDSDSYFGGDWTGSNGFYALPGASQLNSSSTWGFSTADIIEG